MIAVIYSGSRHADWKLANKNGIVSEFRTSGINPAFNDKKYILSLLNKQVQLVNYAEQIKRIYFFGAGVSSDDLKNVIIESFSEFFRYGKVSAENDLQAAALATLGNDKGIVGILGSGANAAFFDGKKIRKNNYGLGYILADEGSANWMGRKLLKHYLNGILPEEIEKKFSEKFDLNRKHILDKVYKQPNAALFLSSFVEFIAENQGDPYVKGLVQKGFEEYIMTYILPLQKQNNVMPVYAAGTVADTFEPLLKDRMQHYGLDFRGVVRKPITNVLNYYIHKNTNT